MRRDQWGWLLGLEVSGARAAPESTQLMDRQASRDCREDCVSWASAKLIGIWAGTVLERDFDAEVED